MLRLRRVGSHCLDVLVRFHMSLHPELAPELEVDDDKKSERNFVAFLQMGILTKKLYINNKTYGTGFISFLLERIPAFLELYGPLVTHLHLGRMPLEIVKHELKFFESFPNLSVLIADDYGWGPNSEYPDGTRLSEMDVKFPASFKNLTKVDIALKHDVYHLSHFASRIHQASDNVEYLALPFSDLVWNADSVDDKKKARKKQGKSKKEENEYFGPGPCHLPSQIHRIMDRFRVTLEDLERKCPEGDIPMLQHYDYKNFYYDDQFCDNARKVELEAASVFMKVCELAVKCDVLLYHVNPAWLQNYDMVPNRAADLWSCVASLVNLHPSVRFLEMKNLQKVEVRSTALSCVNTGPKWKETRPKWPALEILKVTVDSDKLCEATEFQGIIGPKTYPPLATGNIFRFLFSDIKRLALTELELVFKGEGEKVTLRADDIIEACPNLEKLKLGNWRGKTTNKVFRRFWNAFPKLQEVSLEGCQELSDAGFIGSNPKKPVFLELKGKICFKG